MPLLHRKPFVPNPPPKNLGPDDEVFFCPLTKEVFTNYEQFFERTILCNSLVWSCAITERGNMTYQEALDHEETARKKFEKFPKDLQKPMLILVKLMSRSRIEELIDSIFSFIKKRYFIGEQLEVRVKSNKFEMCRVLDIFPNKPVPESAMNGHANGEASSDDEEDDDKPLVKFVKAKHLEPDEVSYQVKVLGASLSPIRTVPWTALRRRVRREQCKIFLKRTCVQDSGGGRFYSIKHDVAARLGMNNLKWEDVFAGPTPTFSSQSPKSKKTSEKIGGKSGKKAIIDAKDESRRAKLEKAKEEMMAQEMKKHEKEMRMEMKKKEAEEAKRQKQILVEQRKKDYREKIEKMREVKKKLAEYKKEWNKQRDDLECDDLKDIPQPREIVTRIPPHLFGDVLSLMEFFSTFENLFDAKDEFPRGVTISMFEKALMDENQDGPMCDLLFFFLSNLFRTQTEEEGENLYVVENSDLAAYEHAKEYPSTENLIAFASLASTWAEKYQGCSLNKLELDSYTVSEVLRLYLLTTTARPAQDSKLWRIQQRGGYCVSDDASLRMCLQTPELIHKLAETSIFNFTPDEKMEILQCLCNHLLSFVTSRDFLDDMSEKYWAAILDYRVDKRSEKRREKDFILDRMKFKIGQVRAPQQNENSESTTKDGEKDQTKQDTIKLMTSEERLEHLKAMDEEEKVAKEAWEFREQQHLKDISLYQRFKMMPLGEDRFFRRYWALNSIPGLIVEEYPDEYITDDLLSVKVQQRGQYSWDNKTFSPTRVPHNSTATPTDTTTGAHLAHTVNNGIASPPSSNGDTPVVVKVDAVENDTQYSNLNNSMDSSSSSQEQTRSDGPGTQGKKFRWHVYTEEEEIEKLLSSLNRRGFRESKLCDSLTEIKAKIYSKLKKCPVNELCRSPREEDRKAKSVNSKIAVELSLRDQILDLESRIFEGTLGGIKEEDGFEWVERVTNSGTYSDDLRNRLLDSVPVIGGSTKMEVDGEEEADDEEQQQPEQVKLSKKDKLVAPPAIKFPVEAIEDQGVENMEQEIEESVDSSQSPEQRKVQDLALALLQIERGIDRKYLKEPLGYSVDISRRKTRSKGPVDDCEEEIAKRKRESAPYLQRWENSLTQCTSFSQISLHLSTLNKCIIWARSVLNASCRICHRRGDADKMLLCDSCDRGHHMYCLKPALKNVPVGDWFCPQCKPIHSNRISPRKVRTTSYSQEASSEEEDDTLSLIHI